MNDHRGFYWNKALCLRLVLLALIACLVAASPLEAHARRSRLRFGRSRPSHERVVKDSDSSDNEKSSGSGQTFAGWASRIARIEAGGSEKWTVCIEDLESSTTIFEYHSERRLVPASNRKLITMGMALELLGPDYHFQTEFGLSAPPEPGHSHYHGDLILKSNGDPSMTDPFIKGGRNPADIFRGWVQVLSGEGIAYIHGNLVIDASAFGDDQNTYPEFWSPSHKNYSYAPVPSALTLCQNLLRVSVFPGSRSGAAGRVSIFPSQEGIEVINNTRTSSRGGGLTATFGDNMATLVLSGSVRRGGEEVATIPLPHPLQYIALVLGQTLADAGIRQTGEVLIKTHSDAQSVAAPLAQRLGLHESPPLAQILLLMMRQSNNFLAEQLWHAAAARAKGRGDTATARQVELDWYRRHNLSWIEPGYDGSGLSRKDAIAASELVSLIKYYNTTAYHDLILQVLPTTGRSGTLRHRAPGNLYGRITAKTGTLAGVSSLTGFIRDRQGNPRLAFSAIGNAAGQTHGRLAGRINELMTIAVSQLDREIAAGKRPAMTPGEHSRIDNTPDLGGSDTTNPDQTSEGSD